MPFDLRTGPAARTGAAGGRPPIKSTVLVDDPARLLPLSPLTVFGLFVVAFLLPLQRTVAE
ncbi:hypothetical protein [Streptomyces adustus]|uniref:hypothetical protein n=1 Tax=Streptomyces adustus TaxID=1609272 RepID=UPI0037123A6F